MRKKGFQSKLFGIILLIVMLTVLIYTVFFGGYVRKLSVEMMLERYENKLQILSDLFISYYDEIDSDMDNFILNESVQKSLTENDLDVLDREMVLKALSLLGDQTDYYLYIDNQGRLYSQKTVGNTVDTEKLGELLGHDYSKTKLIWMEDAYFGGDGRQLFACRFIRAMSQNRNPGILLIRLKQSELKEVLEKVGTDEADCYLLDGQDQIVLEFGREETEENQELVTKAAVQAETDQGGVTKKNGLMRLYADERSQFRILVHVPYRILMSDYYRTLLAAGVFFLLLMILALFVSFRVSEGLARPIQKINLAMQGFHEDRSQKKLELHTGTELDSIGNSYNQMIQQINELVEEVKYREAELRKSEIDSLMYQINPHFLYNTLDAVYMLARLNQEKEIMQMIQALTKLLRINLSNGADFITVQDELVYVKAYMDIVKIRNDNLFSYEIVCGEEVKGWYVVKLLLQPLVENCIKHGFSRMTEGGEIVVKAGETRKMLEFQVKNNGDLILDEDMERINHLSQAPMKELEAFHPQGEGGYGISNVIKRLRLHYGEAVEFQFEREEAYTVCYVRIPKEALKNGKEER